MYRHSVGAPLSGTHASVSLTKTTSDIGRKLLPCRPETASIRSGLFPFGAVQLACAHAVLSASPEHTPAPCATPQQMMHALLRHPADALDPDCSRTLTQTHRCACRPATPMRPSRQASARAAPAPPPAPPRSAAPSAESPRCVSYLFVNVQCRPRAAAGSSASHAHTAHGTAAEQLRALALVRCTTVHNNSKAYQ